MATPTEFRHFRAARVEYVPAVFFRRFIAPAELLWVVERSNEDGKWSPVEDRDENGERFTVEGATNYAMGLEAARKALSMGEEEA